MPYTDENWRRFFEAVDRPDLAADTRFHTIGGRSAHVGDLLALTADIVASRESAHWLALCERLDIPCARLNRLEDLESDPHLSAVDFFHAVPDAADTTAEPYRFTRFPIRMSGSAVAPTLPPRLGQHNREVLSTLGLPDAVLRQLLSSDAADA